MSKHDGALKKYLTIASILQISLSFTYSAASLAKRNHDDIAADDARKSLQQHWAQAFIR